MQPIEGMQLSVSESYVKTGVKLLLSILFLVTNFNYILGVKTFVHWFLCLSIVFLGHTPHLSSLDSIPDILTMCYVEFTRFLASQRQTLVLGIMQQVPPQG